MKHETQNAGKVLDQFFARVPKPSSEQLSASRGNVLERLNSSPAPDRNSADFGMVRTPRWRFRLVAAAVCVAIIGAVAILCGIRTPEPIPAAEAADGSRYRFGDAIRSDGPGLFLKLADGSRVEMRSQSELSLEAAADGVSIHLKSGGVIVSAAKQRDGHLYVQTKDVIVAVVGTVFLVNAEEQGSRVAVIQGEVRVRQGAIEKKLSPGEQVATSPLMESLPVVKEISWSRNADSHLALLAQSLAPLQQVPVVQSTAPPSTGPSIHGRIVDDIRHQSVERARITLSGGELKNPVTDTTTAQGEFHFSDLPPGVYRLSVEKASFITQTFPGVTVADQGDLVLTVGRTISGSVRGADGDPVVGARVQAYSVVGGKVTAMRETAGDAPSVANQGAFRIAGLPPGRYVVAVSVPPAPAPGGGPPPKSIPPMFYPASATPNLEAAIDLRTNTEYNGIAFVIEDKPRVEISGKVVPSDRYPAGSNVSIGLYSVGPGGGPMVTATAQAGEEFHLTGVYPGSYSLSVGAGNAQQDGFYRRMLPIEVFSQPIKDLSIPVPEPAPILGKLQIQDADGAPITPVAKYLLVMNLFGNLSTTATTNAEGDFKLVSTALGESYTLSLPAKPSGAYVAKLAQGGRDLSGGPYTVVAGGDPVEILFKKDAGKLDGTVRDGDKPARSAFVVLAPKVRSAVGRYQTVTAGLDGSFAFGLIAPGDYDLFAFDRNDDDQYLSEDYLRKFKTTSVSIGPSSTASVTVNK